MSRLESLIAALGVRGYGEFLRRDEPLAGHTSYCIGGPADLLATAHSQEQIKQLVGLARQNKVPVLVLGGATNVLVADAGVRGVAILNRNVGYQVDDSSGLVAVQSGTPLRDLAKWAVGAGWAGLAWAVGIPGSIGGAIVGNAGAYGGCMADVVSSVKVLCADGLLQHLGLDDLRYGYRTSFLKYYEPRAERPIVLEATLQLKPGDAKELAQLARRYNDQRRHRTPVGYCAGSVFKRTLQFPAGFLIDQAGLKGYRHGGALVSPLHANFIMNSGNATAEDVKALIEHVQSVVWEQFAQRLESEIDLVGAWQSEASPTG